MRFTILGPIEVNDTGVPVSLGGAKQRATLAYLLMHPNRVVATSRLLQVLWADDPPKSARKILQNAIWGLRGLIGFDQVDLATQAPGYLLKVDPDEIDMHRFLRLSREGRAELAVGDPAAARKLLREGLALWRGPALADLVESGTTWPEVTALQNARLDAFEDCFEAELALGNHHSVLDELAVMVENEPLRERSCGQLMLALYRSGRQADALRAYTRVRAGLVEGLGLEPGQQLQALQQAILNQDPALSQPVDRQANAVVVAGRSADPVQVSVAMIRLPCGGTGEEIRTAIEQFGGTLQASIGSVSLGVFDQPGYGDDNAVQAVRAAAAIREALRKDTPSEPLEFRAAVATGKNRPYRADDPNSPSVDRATLAECEFLLQRAPVGQIWVCEITRQHTSALTYQRVIDDAFSAWQFREIPQPGSCRHTDADGSRCCELELLNGLLDLVRTRRRPHLVTLLGAPGTGKSALLKDFETLLASSPESSRLLVDQTSGKRHTSAVAVQARILSRLCGIEHTEAGLPGLVKLVDALRRITSSKEESDWLTVNLGRLISDNGGSSADIGPAWSRFLELVTVDVPLVVTIDDLHDADMSLLEFIDDLADQRLAVPLLVVVAARPHLLRQHPAWGSGKHHATTMTLDPVVAEATVRPLLQSVPTRAVEYLDDVS
jgi:DNA-binding SARP family transcriptional activator